MSARRKKRSPGKRRRKKPAVASEREILKTLERMLEPEYHVICFYRGVFSATLDDVIEREARTSLASSGTMLYTGIRDLEFHFSTLSAATSAVKRIKSACSGVRVALREYREV